MTKKTYNLNPIYTIEQYNSHTEAMPLIWVVSLNKSGKLVRRPAVMNRFVIVGLKLRFVITSVISRSHTICRCSYMTQICTFINNSIIDPTSIAQTQKPKSD